MLIDWFTVGAQALNFLILVWLMKRFLYQPILRAIDARETRIAAELADADAKKAEAQTERDEFRRKNEEFDQQRAALLSKATDEVNAERHRLLEGTQRQEVAEPPHPVPPANLRALPDAGPAVRVPHQPGLPADANRGQPLRGAGVAAGETFERPVDPIGGARVRFRHVRVPRVVRTRSARRVEKPGTAAISATLAVLTAARLPKRSSSRVRLSGPTPGMSRSSEVMVR